MTSLRSAAIVLSLAAIASSALADNHAGKDAAKHPAPVAVKPALGGPVEKASAPVAATTAPAGKEAPAVKVQPAAKKEAAK